MKLQKTDEGSLPFVCSYLLRSTQPHVDVVPYPIQPCGGLYGPQDEMATLGLQAVSPKSPFINLHKSNEFEIILAYTKPVTLMANVYFGNDPAENQMQDGYVHIEQTQKEFIFRFRLPYIGTYGLRLYGKDRGSAASLPQIHTYLVEVSCSVPRSLPWPLNLCGGWGIGCELYEPKHGKLKTGTNVHFKVKYPGARGLAVIPLQVMSITCKFLI